MFVYFFLSLQLLQKYCITEILRLVLLAPSHFLWYDYVINGPLLRNICFCLYFISVVFISLMNVILKMCKYKVFLKNKMSVKHDWLVSFTWLWHSPSFLQHVSTFSLSSTSLFFGFLKVLYKWSDKRILTHILPFTRYCTICDLLNFAFLCLRIC